MVDGTKVILCNRRSGPTVSAPKLKLDLPSEATLALMSTWTPVSLALHGLEKTILISMRVLPCLATVPIGMTLHIDGHKVVTITMDGMIGMDEMNCVGDLEGMCSLSGMSALPAIYEIHAMHVIHGGVQRKKTTDVTMTGVIEKAQIGDREHSIIVIIN